MDIKKFSGERSGLKTFVVTEERLQQFATSIGAASIQFLPTFLTVLRDGEFEVVERLGFRLSQVLHAEQEYILESSVLPHDEISYFTTLMSVHEKKGKDATLHFLTLETDYVETKADRAIGTAKTTFVIRETVGSA